MKITILGSGVFGCGLANLFNYTNARVSMWSPNEEEVNNLLSTRRNEILNFDIPREINITSDLNEAVKESNLIVFAVPAFAIRSTSLKLSTLVNGNTHFLIASKGIENETGSFLSDIVSKVLKTQNVGVLSGPTFAKDLIDNSSIGFSLSTKNEETKRIVGSALGSDRVKLEFLEDLIGVQICGSIKNVMAIASGILGGMRVSDSTKALFLTEALNDIKYLIKKLGGEENTILSLAGFGDILMTCTSENSRNYTFGKLIGEGKVTEANDYERKTTVEGVYTLKSIKSLIKEKNIRLDLIDLIDDIINGRKEKEKLLTILIRN